MMYRKDRVVWGAARTRHVTAFTRARARVKAVTCILARRFAVTAMAEIR